MEVPFLHEYHARSTCGSLKRGNPNPSQDLPPKKVMCFSRRQESSYAKHIVDHTKLPSVALNIMQCILRPEGAHFQANPDTSPNSPSHAGVLMACSTATSSAPDDCSVHLPPCSLTTTEIVRYGISIRLCRMARSHLLRPVEAVEVPFRGPVKKARVLSPDLLPHAPSVVDEAHEIFDPEGCLRYIKKGHLERNSREGNAVHMYIHTNTSHPQLKAGHPLDNKCHVSLTSGS